MKADSEWKHKTDRRGKSGEKYELYYKGKRTPITVTQGKPRDSKKLKSNQWFVWVAKRFNRFHFFAGEKDDLEEAKQFGWHIYEQWLLNEIF